MSHREKAIIPAFALERTQEVLYLLGEFFRAGQLPDIPVYLDSPLAIKATEIFRRNKQYYDEAAQAMVGQGIDPFRMPNLRFTPDTRESMKINQLEGPAIVIAGNGMCTAGRIKHHLKHNLWRQGASIIIVGFQAEGTTGRQIVDGAKMVRIFGEKVAVRAKVFTIGGLSSHADQEALLRWVGHFVGSKPRVFAIHGEPVSSEALARAIRERFSLDAYVPRFREVLPLGPLEGVPEIVPAAVPTDRSRTMLAVTSDLEAEIRRLRDRLAVKPNEISEADVESFRKIRDDLHAFGSG